MAITHVTLNVNGMSCNHCVNAIESALKDVDGIQSVAVNLKGKSVSISYEDTTVSLEKLKGEIEEAGYDVV